jgi:hypothetical protein
MDSTELFSNGEMRGINRGQSCNNNDPFRPMNISKTKNGIRGTARDGDRGRRGLDGSVGHNKLHYVFFLL